MKKDESPKVNSAKERGNVKNVCKIQGQKSQLSKPFLGCDTCKLKHNLPLKKTKTVQDDQEKLKKNVENAQNLCKSKIKLTDLCEEDKKRIVQLMEELSKFAEKNRSLKESLDISEKAKKEQQECLMKQTNLHLEEKNIFLKEIQTYKSRLEVYENDMRKKMSNWEARKRFMDSEIRHLAKALQKSFNEKSDLMKEIGNLKTCLKQSLESFRLLRNEVTSLQHTSRNPVKAGPSSRSIVKLEDARSDEGPEEFADEYLTSAKEEQSNKDSLNIINNKLEKLYALLQHRTEQPDKMAEEERKEAEPEAGADETKNDPECGKAQTLTSFLREYCCEEPGLDYYWCNESVPSFYCAKTTKEGQQCLRWYIGKDITCTETEECCGDELECITKVCRSADVRIDFALVAKFALATALMVTIFAVFTLCWKGLIEPRCISYDSNIDDDSASMTSERCQRCQGFDYHPEKPPPYEECIPETSAAWSSENPPPYCVAVKINQTSEDSLGQQTSRYFMDCNSKLFVLNVKDIKLQNIPLASIREDIVSSPVSNMEDFVHYTTRESGADSESTNSMTINRM